MKFDIRNKNIVITGASSGIGELMTLMFARRGAKVAIWDISGRGAELSDKINKKYGKDTTFHYIVDVTDRETVRQVAKETLDNFGGRVDVVINNAGIVSGKEILDIPEEKIIKTFEVNSIAPFWVTRAFLGQMLERDTGYIVTVASAAGLVGVAKQTDYSASKFAAVGFMQALRSELRKRKSGVKTLVVCPTYIDTGMFDGVSPMSPLIPIMKKDFVARKIVSGIINGKERLILPRIVGLMPFISGFPLKLADKIYGAFKINDSMDDFKGRK
jgi:all-trans-retinol dehydrogenase (NAD+)